MARHEHRCSMCGRTFRRPEDLRQHQWTKSHGTAPRGSDPRRRHVWRAIAVAGAAAVLAFFALSRGGNLPSVGSHWHADYAIEICGRPLGRQPPSPGDIHTHGDRRIHIHPASRSTSRKAANLGAFFRSLGGTLSDSVLELPGGATYRDGEACAAGVAGSVRVFVNGKEIPRPARYVPQDGDEVLFTFQPASARDPGGRP